MSKVDYNQNLYKTYQKGRALSEETCRQWMGVIARHLSRRHGLAILDLGSGTGRFSPRLAEHFGAAVIGVEPSEKMRGLAEESSVHPRVTYLAGSAEKIPLADETCDFAFMSMILHHIDDLERCCDELRRVLKPGGLVFIRSSFGGRLNSVCYYQYFPRGKEIDDGRLPDLAETERTFSGSGFETVALETIRQEIDVGLKAHYERIKTRSLSTFEFLSEEEIQAGLRAMKEAADREEEPRPVMEAIDLLVLKRTD
jgi:ubiquinone/menaquinone biosynthesis C-methylase UbiE